MSETSAVDSSGGASGGDVVLPATYRFDCLDVQLLGDDPSDPDMDPDGNSIQAPILENTWNSDVENYKLNIMLEVVMKDGMAGTAQVGIRSGIGTGDDDLCSEPSSETAVIDIAYDETVNVWQPQPGMGTCAQMGATGGDGTYQLELGMEQVVYIYAQDTDGTIFNCTADAATPDAVPVRAVSAEVTADVDNQRLAGFLTGCLLETEAEALCSCLGSCNPEVMNENCAACPNGSIPLRDLLGNVGPTTHCTDLLGANAYDLGIAFTAQLLPNVPTTCGG